MTANLLSEFAKEAVKYEDITFDPSGFWGNDSYGTPFEGAPTPEIDARWKRLVRGRFDQLSTSYTHT